MKLRYRHRAKVEKIDNVFEFYFLVLAVCIRVRDRAESPQPVLWRARTWSESPAARLCERELPVFTKFSAGRHNNSNCFFFKGQRSPSHPHFSTQPALSFYPNPFAGNV